MEVLNTKEIRKSLHINDIPPYILHTLNVNMEKHQYILPYD